MIRNIYSYKTYDHAVFARFLPGFISVHGCFYFRNTRQGPFVLLFAVHFLSMDTMDHSYCIPDSTTPSLDKLLAEFPESVPFSVTELELSPLVDCKCHFECADIFGTNTNGPSTFSDEPCLISLQQWPTTWTLQIQGQTTSMFRMTARSRLQQWVAAVAAIHRTLSTRRLESTLSGGWE